jgi:hypothetical protein
MAEVTDEAKRTTWKMLHKMGKRMTSSDEDFKFFDRFVDHTIEDMGCYKCVMHGKQYKLEHPIIKYKNSQHGLFYWTVDFHNTVSMRIGKQPISRDDAYGLYFNDDLCTVGTCADPKSVEVISQPTKLTPVLISSISSGQPRQQTSTLTPSMPPKQQTHQQTLFIPNQQLTNTLTSSRSNQYQGMLIPAVRRSVFA